MNSRYQTFLLKSSVSLVLPMVSKKVMVLFMMARDPSSAIRLLYFFGCSKKFISLSPFVQGHDLFYKRML